MKLKLLLCAALSAAFALAETAVPDFYAKAKEKNFEVLSHSFPEKLLTGPFTASIKLKNLGKEYVRGQFSVETFDDAGKSIRIGRDVFELGAAGEMGDVQELKVTGEFITGDMNRTVKFIISTFTTGVHVVCKEASAVEHPDAIKKRAKILADIKPEDGTKRAIKYVDRLLPGDGPKWRKFIENGGTLIVAAVSSNDDFAGVTEFCDEKRIPKCEQTPKRELNLRIGQTPIFDWPNVITPAIVPKWRGRLSLSREAREVWSEVQVGYTMLLRVGKGYLIVSTQSCEETPALRENILSHLRLEEDGIRLARFYHSYKEVDEYKGTLWYPTISGGETYLRIFNANYASTNLNLALRLTMKALDGSGKSRTFVARRKVSTRIGDSMEFKLSVPALPPDCGGRWHTKTELVEWDGNKSWLINECEVTFPELIELLPPDYRATVSTERREAGVYIGIKANRVNIDMGGKKWKMVAKDSSGKAIAKADGVFAAGTRVTETKLPVAKDAPPGKYTVFAEVETPFAGVKKVECDFFIVAPERGQIIVDQDGFFLNEGKPYFPLGTYHCTQWDWDEKIDETGLTAGDMGFTWLQMWTIDWFSNYSVDPKMVDRHISKNVIGEARQRAIEARIETNKLNRIKIKDIAVCLEGFSFWGDVLYQQPLHVGSYRFEINPELPPQFQSVCDDPDQLVRMWYLADEANGNLYKGLRRATKWIHERDPKLHPTFNLGNIPAVMSGDFGGNDIYIRYYGGVGEARIFAERVEGMRKEYAKYHRRPFIVPQSFGTSWRQPTETPEWVRYETYISLIHGVNGIGYYCWKQTGDSKENAQGMGWNPATAHEVKALIAEVKKLHLSLRVPGQQNLVSLDGNVNALLCGDEETGRYLIAANLLEGAVESELPLAGVADMKFEPAFDRYKDSSSLRKTKSGDALMLKLPQWGVGVWRVK